MPGASVLLLEDELSARKIIASILANAGRDAVIAQSPEDALALVAADRTLRLLVVSGESGMKLCRRVRARRDPVYRHIMVLASRGHRQELVEALEAGADEVLAKPVSPDVLTRSLAVAERVLRTRATRLSLQDAFRDASRQGNGELIVRAATCVARVFFYEGDVAWVAMPGRPSALETLLGGKMAEQGDEVRAVIDECRRTGCPFDEVVVSLGLVSADLVTARLDAWFHSVIADLFTLPDTETFFLPGRREFAGGHRVSVEELLDDAPPSVVEPRWPSIPAPPRLARCERGGSCRGCGDDVTSTVDALLALDSVIGAAVVHGATGQALGAGGLSIDADVMAAQVRLIRSLPPTEQPGELVLSGGSTLHFARATRCELAVVIVLAALPQAPLGLLRIRVAGLAEAISPAP